MIADAMMHAGYGEEAATIARRLLELARGYHWRLPELTGGDEVEVGDGSADTSAPLPYPRRAAYLSPFAGALITCVSRRGFLLSFVDIFESLYRVF